MQRQALKNYAREREAREARQNSPLTGLGAGIQGGNSSAGGGKPSFVIIDDHAIETLNPEFQRSAANFTPPPVKFAGKNDRESVRRAIAETYDGMIMTKTQQHATFGIYKAAVEMSSGCDPKFIAVIIANDSYPIGSQVPLARLPWISFQTRITKDASLEFNGFNLPEQSYYINKRNILFDRIELVNEIPGEKYIYIPDHLPLEIQIFIQREGESFSKESTVISALELYQTVITFLDGDV